MTTGRLCQIVALAALVSVAETSESTLVRGSEQGQQPASVALTLPDRAEFPDLDARIWVLLQQGFNAKVAAPDDPATLHRLVNQERLSEALDVLRGIIARHPDRIVAALKNLSVSSFIYDRSQPFVEQLRAVLATAPTQIARLPKEDAAVAARALIHAQSGLDRPTPTDRIARLKTFIQEYAGTEAAILTEVDVIMAGPYSLAMLDELAAFARQHPGTPAAAKAVYQRGYALSVNVSALRIEPRGADPTPRFLQVLDIVRDLESGAFPPCEWVANAKQLVIQFSASPPIPFAKPENLDAMLNGYRAFVQTHFALDARSVTGNDIGWVITGRMAAIFEQRGDRVGGVEQFLADLTSRVQDPTAVKYFGAMFYFEEIREQKGDTAALLKKAIASLQALHEQGAGPYKRRALATLASAHAYSENFQAARDSYRRYLNLYPDSDWRWVAALRLGQMHVRTGDLAAGVEAFKTVASSAQGFGAPVMRALAHAWAAEAQAGLGRVGDAALSVEQALAAWDDDFGQVYQTHWAQARRPDAGPWDLPADDTVVDKQNLTRRVVELRRSASSRGGDSLERARWLLARGRTTDALKNLDAAATAAQGTPFESDVRLLAHRTRLEQALTLASEENPRADVAAASRALDLLIAEPYDVNVLFAKVARATLFAKAQASTEADTMMRSALEEWRTRQPVSAAPPVGSVEADVVAIRELVLRPRGDGVYESARRGALEWPGASQPFMIVNSAIPVALTSNSTVTCLVPHPIAGQPSVLFLNTDEIGMLAKIIRALGGSRFRPQVQVMERPNQPVGASLDVIAFWNQYFAARPGHWSGWVFETFPIMDRIRFLDEGRTKATVNITVGYTGATVVLAREGGRWIVKELTNFWIT